MVPQPCTGQPACLQPITTPPHPRELSSCYLPTVAFSLVTVLILSHSQDHHQPILSRTLPQGPLPPLPVPPRNALLPNMDTWWEQSILATIACAGNFRYPEGCEGEVYWQETGPTYWRDSERENRTLPTCFIKSMPCGKTCVVLYEKRLRTVTEAHAQVHHRRGEVAPRGYSCLSGTCHMFSIPIIFFN